MASNDQQKENKRMFYNGNVSPPKNSSKPCWYFTNLGYCRYGANCRYRHPGVFAKGSAENAYAKESNRIRVFTNSTWSYRKKQNASSHSKSRGGSYDKHSFKTENPFRSQASKGNHCDQDHVDGKVGELCNKFESLRTDEHDPSVTALTENACETASLCDLEEKNACQIHAEQLECNRTSSVQLETGQALNTEQSQAPKPQTVGNQTLNPRQSLILDDLNAAGISKLRDSEMSYLIKRYPKHELIKEGCIRFLFSSSDPDWSFDVKFVMLQVTLGQFYPEEACDIKVVDENSELPLLLLRSLNQQIKDWLQERHSACLSSGKGELVLRIFLRWLDRNLEQMFIEGLRKVKMDIEAMKAGIEFFPYECLPGSSASLGNDDNVDGSDDGDCEENNIPEHQSNVSLCESFTDYDFQHVGQPTNHSNSDDDDKELNDESVKASHSESSMVPKVASKSGTEIRLLNFELRESAAALECQKISVTVQCTRCKTCKEVITASKQMLTTPCLKCHQLLEIMLQPVILHSNSNVLGNLHLIGCQIIDLPLVQCHFLVDCLNCSKQSLVDGIHYGQAHVTWCVFCSHKFSISAQTAKFLQLQPPERSKQSHVKDSYESSKRKLRDPAFKEGKPLENNGTCKHYKRSHRWLRFPCCGKAYPCDICHDENEQGHEMKFATRMICGFCSKEQPFSKDKPCVSCSGVLTKKAGFHWEGGKGCRNQIKMCRVDRQKYAGVNKTISRKAEALSVKKKK